MGAVTGGRKVAHGAGYTSRRTGRSRILGAASLAVETAAASVPVEDEQAW